MLLLKKSFLLFVLYLSISIVITLFIPTEIQAQCTNAGQCNDPPPSNCIGGSTACVNGVCQYSYECNNSCSSWSAWSPSPCTAGQTQTRFCNSYPGIYQIQTCGGTGGSGASCTRRSECTYPECCNGGICGTCSEEPRGMQCPAGSELVCQNPPAYTVCTRGWLGCDAYFPSKWDPGYFCGATGSEANGNYKEWYGCQTNCACVYPCNLTASQLLLPANGSTQTSTSVTLTWTAASCPDSTFDVYIGTTGPLISQMSLIATVPGTQTSTNFTGTSGQTYYWKVRARNATSFAESGAFNFTINSYTTPWWQVKDGDVTSQGSLISYVPASFLFSAAGNGGYPGVPVYGTTLNLSSTPDRISTTRWNANATSAQTRTFNYTYFKNLIPETVVPTVATDASLRSTGQVADGYEWFKATGSISLNTINFANRKVILFVEGGDLNINGNINVTDGVGFFGAFVNGNINVASTVSGSPSMEGFYLADGNFTSGLGGATQLHIRGSVAALGTMALQRNLVVNSSPAELFEFAPDQMFLFPERLKYRRVKWAEVAP